jgi:hypothetical protein
MHRSTWKTSRSTFSLSAVPPTLLALCLIACGGGSAESDVEGVSAQLVVTAGGGTLTDLGHGTYQLTLHGVGATTGYAAEDPAPASGETSTRTVIEQYEWDESNPPTAAILVTDPAVADTQDTMLVRIMNPRYDEASATLSLDVQLDTAYDGQILAGYVARADASLPASFGQTTVVVDSFWHHFSCSKGYITCYLHYGCCSQPFVTRPLGRFKVDRCWSWSRVACVPCSDDPCKSQFPDECSGGNCYTSCMDANECTPTGG